MSNKEFPLVSVVIPVYNGTNYLREAIDSVLSQTYMNYEILVVDDGSTDGTWEMIQSLGTRVRGLRKTNGGVASALNHGIREMRGQWFAWLSHDDLWLPTKLEEQIRFLSNNTQFKACYTDYLIIDEQGKLSRTLRVPWHPRQIAIRKLFASMYINGSTMVVARECFDRFGLFREELRYTQDAEMWFRILEHYDIGRVPEVLAKQRTHPRQASILEQDGHLREMHDVYAMLFQRLLPVFVTPSPYSPEVDPIDQAKAWNWFADRMSSDRGWDAIARVHYRKSLTLWPGRKNRARLGLLLCMFMPGYRFVRSMVGRLLRSLKVLQHNVVASGNR